MSKNLEQTIMDVAGEAGFLEITYNDHHTGYEKAADYYADIDSVEWVSKKSKKEALANDSVWYAGGKFAASLVDLIPHPDTAKLEASIRADCEGEFSSAYLDYNGHVADECSIEDWVSESHREWLNEDEELKALVTGIAWEYQWYPRTPVGFCITTTSTLEAMMDEES